MARKKKVPKTGFQRILKHQVGKIKKRGGRTAGGKKIRNPKAYVGAGLRRTGVKKYGEEEMIRRSVTGRKKKKKQGGKG